MSLLKKDLLRVSLKNTVKAMNLLLVSIKKIWLKTLNSQRKDLLVVSTKKYS